MVAEQAPTAARLSLKCYTVVIVIIIVIVIPIAVTSMSIVVLILIVIVVVHHPVMACQQIASTFPRLVGPYRCAPGLVRMRTYLSWCILTSSRILCQCHAQKEGSTNKDIKA